MSKVVVLGAGIAGHTAAPMQPARWVLFLRTCPPYQGLRFLWINLKMALIIWKSHG